MSLAFIGLGSNLGDGRRNLKLAWQQVIEHPAISALVISPPYLSKPVDKEIWLKKGLKLSENWFTNAVGAIETSLSPMQLLTVLHGVEKALGREHGRTPDRPVDLDILYFDDLVCSEAGLEIPHPGIRSRPFVLIPLGEIAPEHLDPVSGMTCRQMLLRLPGRYDTNIRQLRWETD